MNVEKPLAESRVVELRPRAGHARGFEPPVEDLTRYERTEGEEDYRHRMMVNLAALGFLVFLIAAGVWLADTMASMRKNQDCVLQGRRNCSPVVETR